MSGATLTIGGAFNAHTGIVSVPSSIPGNASTSSSLNNLLQNYLTALSNSITGGTYSFENNDIAAGSDFVASVSGAAGSFEEFTNTDSTGGVTSTSVSGAYTVSAGVTDLIVQAPGAETITGNSSVGFALFGAGSNVTYDTRGNSNASIVAAGGNDAINVVGMNNSDTVLSAGNDTLTFNGGVSGGGPNAGNEYANAVGNATTSVFLGGSDAATITASDNSLVNIQFLPNAGGNLDFINTSSQAGTVYSAFYSNGGKSFAPNSVTVNAGAGGGIYVGGRAGNNSLVGGAGAVTMIGGGTGDTLIGASSAGNVLFTGTGFETLIASAGSANNLFGIGLYYYGVGQTTASGSVSTDGSGTQTFVIGNTANETLTGSTVSGATNVYDIVGSQSGGETTGGSTMTITNFGPNSQIHLTDATLTKPGDATILNVSTYNGLGGGTEIFLSDGTNIVLQGVSTANVSVTGGVGGSMIGITYN
ncbi:hypothetical protein [Acidocella sp. KAb 2-4]|uniref:beta strand repeat-containing protein n=1 Tax=Acidocella sp. KAb 2-4 TaxID=2885158 RepID=UPI001D05F8DD|nr:hypothetical protein [Acidocella sp. KAb 2-4]MCB5946078.1 hypothetical protein [Acidocella sp. KAb 2-4]